mgnify:CR=1 FL=1
MPQTSTQPRPMNLGDLIEAMAKALLEWETIDADQIDDIVNGRPPRPPKESGSSSNNNPPVAPSSGAVKPPPASGSAEPAA